VGYLRTLPVALDDKLRVEKDVERNGRGIIEVLLRHLRCVTEDDNEKLHSG
jgi:hypothetical protein